MSTPTFADKLGTAFAEHGHLCVGIDPHEYLLAEWGLPVSAVGAHEFGLRVVEASAGRVGIVKPQVAFYERFGSTGYRVLEDVLKEARDAGLVVIADVKRGDLGSTIEAYGQAWLTPGAPLEADAMTISAFQGFGALRTPLDLAGRYGKGLFVLAATSNPEALAVQTAVIQRETQRGKSVAGGLASRVVNWNRTHAEGPIGSIGVVLGATVDFTDFGIDLAELASAPAAPILAPGFGYQGAQFADVKRLFGVAAATTIVTASRSILAAGPDGLGDAIARQAELLGEAIA
ncbi:orotidine-5'-phosphate decarboxylase [Amnibacterium sp. CER49]|uniref:orotidine-5'-phosphate decarboxylase n=1 Tax=Amnibacterium sp. CER49 TaxID=3039161 RepID=UPI0024483A1C|nr:orotidine-5'-phosphate decarboxylase [Amnibacterium sp. CER49]MDH2444337.1 orotidine-5'-phosphate decarboxylase [Amnibacterium sp. CER49]